MTGPPPLDRNGGIWKVIKRELSNTLSAPNVMVQAFHFTTYDLSRSAWSKWTGVEDLNLNQQISKFFKNTSVFVDSGGYQFLQGDSVDLSKWDIATDQTGIYDLQRKYGADKICNLDSPVNPHLSKKAFKESVEINLKNIQTLLDILRDDKTKVHFVVHGRERKEIQYFYNRLNRICDFTEERFNFALGSQVPLSNISKSLVADNANYLLKLVHNDFDDTREVHLFGVGSNLVRHVDDIVNFSYDNSTFVRNAMYHRWYNVQKHSYEGFSPASVGRCGCYACRRLEAIGSTEIINLFAGEKNELGITKSDIMGYIALHNIFHEKDRVNSGTLSPLPVPTFNVPQSYHTKNAYEFPLRGFKPNSKNLIVLKCSSLKPYSKSRTHRKVKKYLKDTKKLEEGKDYDVVTLSGLFGPVHWKDENRPEILTYDYRLTNMSSKEQLSSIQMKTATVIGVIGKRYEGSYSILDGIYNKVFGNLLEKMGVKVFHRYESFEL